MDTILSGIARNPRTVLDARGHEITTLTLETDEGPLIGLRFEGSRARIAGCFTTPRRIAVRANLHESSYAMGHLVLDPNPEVLFGTGGSMVLIGNVGDHPDLRYFQGRPVTSVRLAVDRQYHDADGALAEKTSWWDVDLWGEMAEEAATLLEPGDRVLVRGHPADVRVVTSQAGYTFVHFAGRSITYLEDYE